MLLPNSVQKIQIVADTAVREVDACKKLRDELHNSMQKTEKDIVELKDRVAHERVVRQHKEEYALLAQKVYFFTLIMFRVVRQHKEEYTLLAKQAQVL